MLTGLPACLPPSLLVSLLLQANRNWAALIDDFIDLDFLPADANRWVRDLQAGLLAAACRAVAF